MMLLIMIFTLTVKLPIKATKPKHLMKTPMAENLKNVSQNDVIKGVN